MSWWQYLLLVNIYLVLFYGFYVLLLRRETFFHLNRIYLVASALLSFFIPVIHSDWVKNLFITQQVQHTLSVYSGPIMVYHFKPIEEHHITIGQIILIVYAIGAGALIAKFIWQLISLKRIIDRPEGMGAFSFFKSIRLGANLDKQEVIAAHEQAHARQWHSADVLLIEAIAIINWFNPVVYFYRFGIKHIHEFIADRQALKNGMDRAEYALLLLSQTFRAPAHQLVNPFFNHSLLKQRIIMLQKSHSQRIALLKYGLLAPLFILMLILSAATISKSATVKLFNKKAEEVLTQTIKDNPPVQQVQATEVPLNKITVKINHTPPMPGLASSQYEEPIFITVEKEPKFKGGISEFYNFLSKNIQYPDAMLKRNVQGKVFISLTVEKDGSLSDIKAVRDIGFGAAEEAIRVLKLSPKWEPGYQNGQRVRVRYTLPINFAIVSTPPVKDTTTDVTMSNKEIAEPSNKPLYSKIRDTSKASGTTLIGLDTQMNPLYIVDGKEVPTLDNVNSETIESISVLKKRSDEELYAAMYSKKALNGVVLIKTKGAVQKQTPAH
jgi:beta-lactamase regulating signal transducer with metallopeptidase domain